MSANGTHWLHEWGVDVQKSDPVVSKYSATETGRLASLSASTFLTTMKGAGDTSTTDSIGNICTRFSWTVRYNKMAKGLR